MKNLFLLLGLCLSFVVSAQKSADIEAIKGQCGCMNITFKYAETFAPDTAYEFHDRYLEHATEYVFVVEESANKVVIQHLLAINDTMVVKHWREDWTYRDPHLLSFNTANDFRYSNISNSNFKNGWTQKVYGTQDELRYAGTGEWAHINGKSVWESTADAALPRREYSHRKDYNVMKRGNRIHVTDKGYLHEQDNDKIIRAEGKEDVLLASEKGYNDYVRTDMSKCAATKAWWEKNKGYWQDVRAAWDKVENEHKSFTIKSKVDDQRLGSFFYNINKENLSSAENKKKLDAVLKDFIVFEKGI
ncbi:DUF6607 family protein [uncultured Arcticibacterium sp.]|uniref:DUF6607 family protein n=1 Tax=uncultured Arcticibacterium sp. TaxID=2173042 RepID=UPI0030FD09F5